MASFTGVGDSLSLTMTHRGQDVWVNLSGTYNMTILLQREVGAPGSGAYETIKSYTTANATVSETYTTKFDNETLRLIVDVDTSGTAVAYLVDATTEEFDRVDVRDPLGGSVADWNQRGLTVAGGHLNDIPIRDETRALIFEDFIGTWAIGDAGPADLWSSTAGAGTGNAVATTVANSLNGEVTLKSASDDGAHAANFSAFTGINLGYKANQGGLSMGARIKLDDVSEAYLFVGFTDVISTTVEGPIFMNGAAIDSDAADACGVVYDVDATTDQFYVGGVDTNTDTDPIAVNSITPSDGTYFKVRVEVSSAGVVSAWIDDTFLGSVGSAVTPTVALTPAIVVGNRSANQVIATIDYIWVAQDR